jgi:hypothetical protein
MKNYIFYLSVIAGLILVALTGCDPEEPIPAYLTINSMRIFDSSYNYAAFGTSSSKIKDAWVYIDGNLLGIFEIPARFPVLAEGNHAVTIAPGIYENGISATRTRYPLYKSFETVVNFKPGETVAVPDTLNLNYFSSLSYTWYEDFEGNTYSFDSIEGSTAGFIPFNLNNDDPFGGAFSGRFIVNETKNYFIGSCTNDAVDINGFSTAWIELNYKADQRFNVGLRIKKLNDEVVNEYAVTVNSSPEWNKIYINVSKIAGAYPTAKNFKVYIDATLESGRTESSVYLDNIKLIHN